MSTTTPNMNLIVPTVGSEPGPAWANEINGDLGILDQHSHTSGQGVPITPAAININANLPMNSNSLTTVETINYNNLSGSLAGSAPNLGCSYVAAGELYYNDEAGNVVQITKTGSVNAGAGSITGLPSGTASASFSSATFVWQSATNTAANMDARNYIFRNSTASSHGLTLSPPNAMAADYSLVLPSIPGTTSIMSLDTSGNMGASYVVDNSTIVISSNTIEVPTGGITATQLASNSVTTVKIADGAVTRAKIVAPGQQVSSSCGDFTAAGNSPSYNDITNLSVTITTTGNPVNVYLIAISGGVNTSYIRCKSGSVLYKLLRGSTAIQIVEPSADNVGQFAYGSIPLYTDVVAAGTYTYKMQYSSTSASGSWSITNWVLIAYEIT